MSGRGSLLLVVLLLIAFFLSSCSPLTPEEEKAQLSSRIESVDVGSCDTVTECLSFWKFPKGYNAAKLREVEKKMQDGFYKKLNVPAMAKLAAQCFMTVYYDDISFSDTAAYTDALIRCLVMALGDDYAIYRTAEEYGSYQESMSGSYGGIGMTVKKNFDTGEIRVVRLISDSPAQRAGVLVGDLLYSVEGMAVTKETMDEAFAKMQGEVGDAVRFTVLRDGVEIPFEIVRENMENMTVSYTISEEKIATITVTSFKSSTYKYFKKAVDDAEEAGAVGFIFDMRDNPGGYLSSVLTVLEYLVPDDTELCSYGTEKESTVYVASEAYDGQGTDHVISVPCVVLCNGATASAGELFTAALRDYNDMGILRATVIGTDLETVVVDGVEMGATFGKGIMQSSYTLSDKSVITMTSAFYNPPCGVNYHGVGVIPDVACEQEQILDTARQALLDLIGNK